MSRVSLAFARQCDVAVALPDAYPASSGHHLVLSRRHEPDYFNLTTAETGAVSVLVSDVRELIVARWNPGGFNVGVNVGTAAGQTFRYVHVTRHPPLPRRRPGPARRDGHAS